MAGLDLMVKTEDGKVVYIEITRAWASILKAKEGIHHLRSIILGQGIPWNKVIGAEIHNDDPDYGFSTYKLLDG